MHKIFVLISILMGFAASGPFCPETFPETMNDVSSEHVLMRLPQERALLGRRVISDLERYYQYVNKAIDVKLPKRIVLLVDWDLAQSRTNFRESSIIIGMNQPLAVNSGAFLLDESMREITRMGLYELSQGADRPDYEFLYEGMIEILVSEFNHTTRKFESAWVIAKLLDEMGQLGLEPQRSWAEFSSKHRCYRNSAPGITFLLTMRELKGRERLIKFFEALKRANLTRSLQDAFDEDPASLEAIWLKKVRAYAIPAEISISTDSVPRPSETELVPKAVQAGNPLKIRLLFGKNENILLPDGVFLRDERTGRLYQAREDSEYISGTIPVEADTPRGEYSYTGIAIDESGNLGQWKGTYKVASSQ